MDYIYGTNGDSEILKTVGKQHTDYSGFLTSVREYDDGKIVDLCKIVDHYDSAEDVEGNCYDFYTISDHNRHIDKSDSINATEGAIVDLADMVASHEDAIADLANMVGNHETTIADLEKRLAALEGGTK